MALQALFSSTAWRTASPVLLCVMMLGLFIQAPGLANAPDPDLSAQLRALQDEKQIHQLILDYAEYLEKFDFAAFAGLFAKDGTWTGNTSKGKPVQGPDAIRTLMEQAFAGKTWDPAHINRVLLMTHIRIHVDGDQATSTSRYSVIDRRPDNSLAVDHIGQVSDEFIRENGKWKFLSRTTRGEMP